MNGKTKSILWVLIFALFIGLAYVAYNALSANFPTKQESQIQQDQSAEKTETAAPDFVVFDQQGKEVRLSDYKGKPVVLNFWASWCPPCRGEMPHFNEIYNEVKENTVFIMVDLVDGQRETQATGKAFIKEQDYVFPVYFDNQQKAAVAYNISSIPTTFFINSRGNIVKAYEGAIDKKTLQAGIDLIKE
jgi:thiol-disulfide isomerase/thioredoxin